MAGAHTLAPPKHEYRFDRRVSRPANDQPESHQETEPMSRHHSGHPTALLLLALGLIVVLQFECYRRRLPVAGHRV